MNLLSFFRGLGFREWQRTHLERKPASGVLHASGNAARHLVATHARISHRMKPVWLGNTHKWVARCERNRVTREREMRARVQAYRNFYILQGPINFARNLHQTRRIKIEQSQAKARAAKQKEQTA